MPPYSIGVKQEDGSYEYTTFSRLDPLSALLIMGADLAQYSKYHEEDISLLDPKDYDDIIKNYVLAVSDYATNMPFLQGIAELQSAAGGQYQTKEDFIKRMAKWTGQKWEVLVQMSLVILTERLVVCRVMPLIR